MHNAVVASGERMPLDEIDLFSPEGFRSSSQHLAWQTLRETAPVWPQSMPDGTRFWSVTRFDDVVRVIKDHRAFSSEHGTILAVLGGDPAAGKAINLMDPPAHQSIRLATMPLLSASAIQATRDLLRTRIRALVAGFPVGEPFDVAPLLLGLPMMAVGDVIGLPEEHWGRIARLAMSGVAPADPHFAVGDPATTLRIAHAELFELLNEAVADRRARPREDIASTLLGTAIHGRPLTFEEAVLNCYSFLMGANTTTPHAAAQMIHAFAERPGLWRELKRSPSGVSRAVEESLRWASPTNHFVRRVNHPVEIAGVRLDAGELVCAWIASANRDPAVFRDPYDFDPKRHPNPHLAFGNGIHYCNGAHGARAAMQILLEELLYSFEAIEPAGRPQHLYSNFINGMTSLPILLRPLGSPAVA